MLRSYYTNYPFSDNNYDLFNYNQSIAGLILIFSTPRDFDQRSCFVCLFCFLFVCLFVFFFMGYEQYTI